VKRCLLSEHEHEGEAEKMLETQAAFSAIRVNSGTCQYVKLLLQLI